MDVITYLKTVIIKYIGKSIKNQMNVATIIFWAFGGIISSAAANFSLILYCARYCERQPIEGVPYQPYIYMFFMVGLPIISKITSILVLHFGKIISFLIKKMSVIEVSEKFEHYYYYGRKTNKGPGYRNLLYWATRNRYEKKWTAAFGYMFVFFTLFSAIQLSLWMGGGLLSQSSEYSSITKMRIFEDQKFNFILLVIGVSITTVLIFKYIGFWILKSPSIIANFLAVVSVNIFVVLLSFSPINYSNMLKFIGFGGFISVELVGISQNPNQKNVCELVLETNEHYICYFQKTNVTSHFRKSSISHVNKIDVPRF